MIKPVFLFTHFESVMPEITPVPFQRILMQLIAVVCILGAVVFGTRAAWVSWQVSDANEYVIRKLGFGEYDLAKTQLEQLTVIAPESAEMQRWLGRTLLLMGSFRNLPEAKVNSVKAYERAIALDPLSAEYFFELFFAYQAVKQFIQAEQALKNALLLDPNNGDFYYRLGFFYESQKRFAEAIVAYKKSLFIVANDRTKSALARVSSTP
jgi:tetratricopeptide (TPR) repeat protein